MSEQLAHRVAYRFVVAHRTAQAEKKAMLTATQVKHASPGDHQDGGGLYLRVTRDGAKSWVYRFMLHGVRHKMGLGTAGDGDDGSVSLADARILRDQARSLVKTGTDPIEARKKQKRDKQVAVDSSVTLTEARERWRKVQEWDAESGSSATREEYLWSMYGAPKLDKKKGYRRKADALWLGNYPVSELLDGDLIVKVFSEVVSAGHQRSARYALQNLRGMIDFALDEYKLAGTNPIPAYLTRRSRFMRRLPSLKHETNHYRAMPWQEVPALIAQLRTNRGSWGAGPVPVGERTVSAELLEFQILTGARPAQARLAQWPEFDLDNQTWTVPHHTTVMGKRYYRRKRNDSAHIYINRQAVQLLRAIRARQEAEGKGKLRLFVFSHGLARTSGEAYSPSSWWRRKQKSQYAESDFRFGGKVIAESAVREYMRTCLGIENCDPHGFRGSLKKFQIDNGYNELAGEAVLDHKVGDATRNAYAQGAQPYNQVVELMDHWGQYCDGKKAPGRKTGTVIHGKFPQRGR
jgi:integrase